MEKEKNNSSLIALVVVLLILVLGNNYNNYASNKENNSTNNNTQSYSYNLAKRSTDQAVRQEYIEILVDTDGNAYLYAIDNSDNENNSQIKINIKKLETKFKTYSPKGYTYIDGSTELKAYKLNLRNVLTAYYVHMGNGGFSYFIFVKENGKLSYLSYDKIIYDGEIELKDINNVENVVSIVENTFSMTPYAVTSDGSELSLSDYIQ